MLEGSRMHRFSSECKTTAETQSAWPRSITQPDSACGCSVLIIAAWVNLSLSQLGRHTHTQNSLIHPWSSAATLMCSFSTVNLLSTNCFCRLVSTTLTCTTHKESVVNNLCSAYNTWINTGSSNSCRGIPYDSSLLKYGVILFYKTAVWSLIMASFGSSGTAEAAWRRQMLLLLLLLTVLRSDNTQSLKVMTTWTQRAPEKSSRRHVGNCSCCPVKFFLIMELKLRLLHHMTEWSATGIALNVALNTFKRNLDEHFRDMIIWPYLLSCLFLVKLAIKETKEVLLVPPKISEIIMRCPVYDNYWCWIFNLNEISSHKFLHVGLKPVKKFHQK